MSTVYRDTSMTSGSPPAQHFLSLPRPDAIAGPQAGIPDTTTVAAHDFDVDARSGFMPPQPPLARLPHLWEAWEAALEEAISRKLKLGSAKELTRVKEEESEKWRQQVRKIPVLPTEELKSSEIILRRAHHVLTWIMHFYINTIPPTAPIIIPRSISVPLLEVSDCMVLPPLLTYSDDVLYNWKYRNPNDETAIMPTISNITVQTTFTQTPSEAHFYLTSAYIELRGAVALSLMSLIMDEAFVRDAVALRRISRYLQYLARVIDELRELLLAVRDGCDPEVFYNEIRPWFKGQDSMHGERRWIFEGIGEPGYEHLKQPADNMLHGPSAGQSSLIHAFDVFFGVESHAHGPPPPQTPSNVRSQISPVKSDAQPSNSGTGTESHNAERNGKGKEKEESFLHRMRAYMPRHHRAFLAHLAASPRPLRALVTEETEDGAQPELLNAYNTAISTLRAFRDAHIRVVAMYIVGPAHRSHAAGDESERKKEAGWLAASQPAEEKGTGGTPAMAFLKDVRDRTAEAVL